jgi:uncharacterized protein YpmS
MISFLFYFCLLYFVYKVLVSGWVVRFTRMHQVNDKQQQEPTKQRSNQRTQTTTSKTQLGEYVDYEEVKE